MDIALRILSSEKSSEFKHGANSITTPPTSIHLQAIQSLKLLLIVSTPLLHDCGGSGLH
jgi:hypothetical protein